MTARGVGERVALPPEDVESNEAPRGLTGGDSMPGMLASLGDAFAGRGESLRDFEGVK